MKPAQKSRPATRRTALAGLAVVAVIASVAVVSVQLAPPARQEAPVASQEAPATRGLAPIAVAPDPRVTQATICETPYGVCTLATPQAVGSLCQCPGVGTGRAIL